MKKIERLQKHLEVKKLEQGGILDKELDLIRQQNPFLTEEGVISEYRKLHQFDSPITQIKSEQLGFGEGNQGTVSINTDNIKLNSNGSISGGIIKQTNADGTESTRNITKVPKKSEVAGIMGGNNQPNVPWGMIGDTAIAATNAVEDALMGDKNFSASSNALDSAVDATASAASKFGPWGLLAAGALKTFNFITKIGGKTVQGFDVNEVDNSGYSQDMFHQQSESGRIWDNMSGKLKRRNARAKMALAALDVSNDEKYEQEARTNSVTNVLQQNQIALAGGIDPSLLAS